MKKNKKGFSLVELIATILILSILLLLAVPAYNAVMNRYRRKIYQEKITLIKIAAEKYAQDQRISSDSAYTVAFLIEAGYLTPDKTSDGATEYDMVNPVNGKSMLCYIASVKIKNATYNATVNESYNCDAVSLKTYANDLIKYVFECDDSGCQTGNINSSTYDYIDTLEKNSILLRDKTFNGKLLTEWSNKDLLLVMSTSRDIDYNGSVTKYDENGYLHLGKKDNLSQRIHDCYTGKSYCSNTYVISCEAGNLCTHPVEVHLIPDEKSQTEGYAAIYARIDKNNPTVTATSPDEWTNQNKAITVITSDDSYGMSGSGIASVKVDNENLEVVDGRAVSSKKPKGSYNVVVQDEAGNTTVQNVSVTNIDIIRPNCTEPTWAPNEYGYIMDWENDTRLFYGGCKDEEGGSGCESDKVEFAYTWPPKSTARVLTKIPPSTGVNEGQAEVEYTIYDRAGNSRLCRVDNGAVPVNLEKIPPEILRVSQGNSSTGYSVSCTGNGLVNSTKSCTATFKNTYPSNYNSVSLKVEARDTTSGLLSSYNGVTITTIGRYIYLTRVGYSKVTKLEERQYNVVGKKVTCWKYPQTSLKIADVAGNTTTIYLKTKFSGYRECKYV